MRLILTFLRRPLCSSLLKNFFSLKRSFKKSTWPSRLSRWLWSWWYRCQICSPPPGCLSRNIGRFSLGQTFLGSSCTCVFTNEIQEKILVHRICQPWFGIKRVLFEGLDDVSISGLVQDWPVHWHHVNVNDMWMIMMITDHNDDDDDDDDYIGNLVISLSTSILIGFFFPSIQSLIWKWWWFWLFRIFSTRSLGSPTFWLCPLWLWHSSYDICLNKQVRWVSM